METAVKAKEFPEFKFIGAPMTKEQTGYLLKMVLASQTNKEVLLKEAPDEIRNMFPAAVLLKRIEVYKLKFMVSEFFMMMSCLTMVKTPGDTMILLRLCYQYWKKTGKEFLDINDWCEMFPMGVPTDDEKLKMWDSQKCERGGTMDSDNMVDYLKYWQ